MAAIQAGSSKAPGGIYADRGPFIRGHASKLAKGFHPSSATRLRANTSVVQSKLAQSATRQQPEARTATSSTPGVGFGFSGAGLLFPYYIGVVQELQEAGALRPGSKLAGASAGSIIAVATTCGVDMSTVTQGCKDVFQNYRRWGTAGRMRATLEDTLDLLLPHDAHERCKDSAYVAVTQLMPFPASEALSEFTSKTDLIASLLTSCHIPLYFDSYIETFFRKGLYVDGGVGQFLPEPPGCDRVVKISALPTSIAANVLGHKWDIAPDVFNPLKSLTFPRSVVQALLPASEMEFDELIGQGREDTSAWLKGQGRMIL